MSAKALSTAHTIPAGPNAPPSPPIAAPSSRSHSSNLGSASMRVCSRRALSPGAASPASTSSRAHVTNVSGRSAAARRETSPPPCPSKTANIATVSSGAGRSKRTQVASSMAGRQPCISEDAHLTTTSSPSSVDFSLLGPRPSAAKSIGGSALPLPAAFAAPFKDFLPLHFAPSFAAGFSIARWTPGTPLAVAPGGRKKPLPAKDFFGKAAGPLAPPGGDALRPGPPRPAALGPEAAARSCPAFDAFAPGPPGLVATGEGEVPPSSASSRTSSAPRPS
mmetsp:Transcript_117060/g.331299  ORF Transcript_117060/g.331299 Transcript_117060/m.331299 type:complete len:278 (-) Transcript_117060:344-1177(-)